MPLTCRKWTNGTTIFYRRSTQRREGATVFGSTMVLTIGTALDRAKDEELTVRMCIGGEWISGRILSCDGQAVAVHESSGDICVVRKDTISCVRMPSRAHTGHVPTQQHSGGVAQQVGVLERSGTAQA